MSESDNVLDYLRTQFAKVHESQGRMLADMIEVKERLGLLEGGFASISRRVDRIDIRLDRIERRIGPGEV